jgi:hypothetical protein
VLRWLVITDPRTSVSPGHSWEAVWLFRAALGGDGGGGFDVLILWSAFLALHAHPVPPFPVVIMAYVIDALGGSIPLPGAAGTIGGMAGTLILYGVAANAALATVLVHQAIGLLVPLVGGAIAYAVIRRRLGPIRASAANGFRSLGVRRRRRWWCR